jgi:hypothetical protein
VGAVFIAAGVARAGPVPLPLPLLQDTSGRAVAFVGDYNHPDVSDARELAAPGAGATHVIQHAPAEEPGHPAVNTADLSWSFQNGQDSADLRVHLDARIFNSTTGGDLGLVFTTDGPLNYRLRVHTLEGTGLEGSLDDKDLNVRYSPIDDTPFDTLESSGVLPPGMHHFGVHGESFIFRFDAPFDLEGDVSLKLGAAATTMIPLAPAFVPGIALMTGLAVFFAARRTCGAWSVVRVTRVPRRRGPVAARGV